MKTKDRKAVRYVIPSVLRILLSFFLIHNKIHAEKDVPERVIALSRSNAELWMLAGGSLAGITEDALSLEGLSENVVVIGTISKPNTEAIIGLNPDLVLFASDIPSQKNLQTQLEGLNIRCVEVSLNSFSDYAEVMKQFTELTGREDLYRENVAATDQRIQSILAEYKPEEGFATFLTLRVSSVKNKVLKADHFANEIFSNLGLVNIVQDESTWDDLNVEAVIEADPDYIFIVLQGDSDKAVESYSKEFESRSAWQNLKAVKSGRLFFLPKGYFQYKPNAKWDEAYEYALEIISR